VGREPHPRAVRYGETLDRDHEKDDRPCSVLTVVVAFQPVSHLQLSHLIRR
jgi:hypothetical protein